MRISADLLFIFFDDVVFRDRMWNFGYKDNVFPLKEVVVVAGMCTFVTN